MIVSVLYVQCVAVLIWKVKNIFDLNRTGSMKPQELLMGSPCSTGDPPPHAMDQTRSSSTAVPSNPGTVEREETEGLAFRRISGESKRIVCSVCSCPYLEGEECIRCEQDREYETSRPCDGGRPSSSHFRTNEVKAHSPPLKSWNG